LKDIVRAERTDYEI